ncbi:26S proteasome subunit RPN2a [Fistulina hepatica ATCC 64428]|uniref:26S proteasome regulatory subunit RPN2 n=1 Tax=Fistulina hepatica ATCC 64428 TaxID=1128425 RepID=A0A0D7AI96_9AGAR|nr:26S proteasome subunit RPN2a [Fistulina hepatica ATCC 64428]
MVLIAQSSAGGVLALLSEPDAVFKHHAIKALNPLVVQFWAEISEHITQIESLYEDTSLPAEARDLAALLASKVYYFLGEYDDALYFALCAGSAFDIDLKSDANRIPGIDEYAETVISKALDRYIEQRSQPEAEDAAVDPKLQSIVERIFQRSINDGDYKQAHANPAIGIALDSHRLDIVRRIYERTDDASLLSYAMSAVTNTAFSLSYRDRVLNYLFTLYPRPGSSSSYPHVHALTRLLVTLANPSLTVNFLSSLIPDTSNGAPSSSTAVKLAYQFAFDLVQSGAPDFLSSVLRQLPEGTADTKPTHDRIREILSGRKSVKLNLAFLRRNNHVDPLVLKHTKDALDARSSIYHTALTLQNAFTHAGTTSDVFLRENLEWLGLAANWAKFSATAALGVIHKGFFEQGQTILAPYLPATNPPAAPVPGAAYSEGGALYALGLINAGIIPATSGSSPGSTSEAVTYLRSALRAAGENAPIGQDSEAAQHSVEVVQHGAALGLGIAAMGTRDLETFELLKDVLFTDSAVAGETAGIAMGLVMLGAGMAAGELVEGSVKEMLVYAHETRHEKIIRGLALGVAFIFYGRQEESDWVVSTLIVDKDPILRYGGVYALALAYAGTANNNAVRKLLHVAVSDTSDDVRRAAVTALAFLLFKSPQQVPRIVQLLSESYNPHVRCGATLALGLACAGTGLADAVAILEPMTRDSVDFVRQGAFIALGMVLVQQADGTGGAGSASGVRALYAKVVADKHEDPMARFGAALGQGLIDAAGRNATISLGTGLGANRSAIVGMTLFCQFWYWYPLAHCACLAFTPTGIIGLNSDLKIPKFDFVSNARPSMFAYPAPTKPPTKATVSKVATAVLSTTAKVKAREKRKAAAEGEDDAMDTDKKDDGDIDMKPAKPTAGDISPIAGSSEPSFEVLPNFSRVTPAQLTYISFPADGRYQPVRPVSLSPKHLRSLGLSSEGPVVGGGILILDDRYPDQPEEFIELQETPPVSAASVPGAAAPAITVPASQGPDNQRHMDIGDGPEADLPPPFEYPFGND